MTLEQIAFVAWTTVACVAVLCALLVGLFAHNAKDDLEALSLIGIGAALIAGLFR